MATVLKPPSLRPKTTGQRRKRIRCTGDVRLRAQRQTDYGHKKKDRCRFGTEPATSDSPPPRIDRCRVGTFRQNDYDPNEKGSLCQRACNCAVLSYRDTIVDDTDSRWRTVNRRRAPAFNHSHGPGVEGVCAKQLGTGTFYTDKRETA